MRIALIGLSFVLPITGALADAPPVTLDAFLGHIRSQHPFLVQEALSADIARMGQKRLRGDEDWELAAGADYTHNDTTEVGFGTVDAFDASTVQAGIGREFWLTGGRVDVFYDYTVRDQDFNQSLLQLPGDGGTIDIAGPRRFYQNAVGVAWTQPLWQNRGGDISRLAYDLEGYTVDQTDLLILERQEEFLLQQALAFLDWVRLEEERQIAQQRLDLAQQELDSTRNRYEANLVEEADLLRAKNALLEGRRNLRLVDAEWKARQAELAVQAQDPALLRQRPAYDLYTLKALPEPDAVVARLHHEARVMRQLRLRDEQLVREREGLASVAQPSLDLVVSGGLKDGEQAFDEAVDFDQPDASVAIELRYPLGNRTARADLERNVLARAQVRQELLNREIQLESEARAVLTQLSELEDVLALNAEQVSTAGDKTAAEDRLYQQGRNQLNFVIQSRDEEAIARQIYAVNAVAYHRLWLQLQALSDELLPAAPR